MAITRAPSGTASSSLTANASPNVKGSWVEVIASTPEDVKGFFLITNNAGTASTRISVDIGTGAAAAETVLVADIHWSMGETLRVNNPCFYLPVAIPSGTRVSARAASSTGGAASIGTTMHLFGGSGGGTCVTYGVSSNQATQVDPGGVANTLGAYSQITAATTADINYLSVIMDLNANTAPQTNLYELWLATGGAGSETPVVQRISFGSNGNADHCFPVVHSFPITIPSGTRLAVAGRCDNTDATDRLCRVSIIGFSAVPN